MVDSMNGSEYVELKRSIYREYSLSPTTRTGNGSYRRRHCYSVSDGHWSQWNPVTTYWTWATVAESCCWKPTGRPGGWRLGGIGSVPGDVVPCSGPGG